MTDRPSICLTRSDTMAENQDYTRFVQIETKPGASHEE